MHRRMETNALRRPARVQPRVSAHNAGDNSDEEIGKGRADAVLALTTLGESFAYFNQRTSVDLAR
jgi:hypothetical protein